MQKVLIANRGEIAVRVARACKDHGLSSVAVYANQDRNAQHVRACDEAFALNGETATETYLAIPKILEIALRSGADAIHPGYGFLSENADFAQAVIEAGLTWIGPPPSAIRALGDKVAARHIAQRVGAPLVAGTPDPVTGAEEVVAFAKAHGLPVAIKAAFGGGGRGLKVARVMAEISELYDSAVREAISAFGRGECFVERYLDKPRHVETQVLADQHGNVVVISTRDCSVQRRHQKLVEEAPAPFLNQGQIDELYSSSKAIMLEAGYVGAGTCEFLIGQDGTISFLEVNTRLQVEHPVSEEVSGIDLVREQFRIADGERLGYNDPEMRGHSIEFRINGEDPGRGFLPSPGIITNWQSPSGPGVRLDAGFGSGDEIGGNFDSLLGKLIITGSTRQEALARARRALDEFVIEGMPTALPFHRSIVNDPAFNSIDVFKVHTSWIESEFKNDIPPFSTLEPGALGREQERQTIAVEIDGRRIEVSLPTLLMAAGTPSSAPRRSMGNKKHAGVTSASLVAPMQGTVVKIAVADGDTVVPGSLILVVEAMKMEQPLLAHRAGRIANLNIQVGAAVASGVVLCEIVD